MVLENICSMCMCMCVCDVHLYMCVYCVCVCVCVIIDSRESFYSGTCSDYLLE